MAYVLSPREQISYAPQSDFVTAASSGFTVIPSNISDFAPALETFSQEQVRSGWWELDPIPGSPTGGTLTLSIPMLGVSATTPAANPTANIVSDLFKQFGAESISGYVASNALTAWSGTTISIDDSNLSTLYKSGGAIIGRTSGGDYETAILSGVTDSGGGGEHTLTSLFPLTGTSPHADDGTFGTVCIYGADTQPTPLTFKIQTSEYLLTLVGCHAQSLKVSFTPKGVMVCDVSFGVDRVTVGSGSAISVSAYTLPKAKALTAAYGAKHYVGTSQVNVKSMDLELTQDLVQVPSLNAQSGVIDRIATNRVTSLTWTQILSGQPANMNSLTNPSKVGVFWGTAPGAMGAFCMPSPVLMGVSNLANDSNTRVQTYTCRAGQYTGDDSSTAPGDTHWRLYLG